MNDKDLDKIILNAIKIKNSYNRNNPEANEYEKMEAIIMYDDDKKIIRTIALLVLGVVFFILLLFWIAYKYDVEIGQANIVDVYCDDVLIYDGKQAFITIDSGGMTTTVTIYKNLFPPIVYKKYSSNNIKVLPKKALNTIKNNGYFYEVL
jgi:hypothetical protein